MSPVLPPAATPEALSTNVVTVDVPKTEPAVVPMASARRPCLQLGIEPSSLISPDLPAQAMNVPTVSNMSTNRKVRTTVMKSKADLPLEKMSLNANSQKYGEVGRNEPPAY